MASQTNQEEPLSAVLIDRSRRRRPTWLGWMALFAVIGVVATVGIQYLVDAGFQRADSRKTRAAMRDQMDLLRRGQIDCLVQPDPRFIDEILADKACAVAVRDVYLGGDVSDPRLGRLREFPHLRSIVFLFADSPDNVLESLRGMASIEGLSFEHVRLSRRNFGQIASFPNLKSLCFPQYRLTANDLQPLERHPSLERLALTKATLDRDLLPLFQSMPRLRYVGIGDWSSGEEPPEKHLSAKSLREALPGCECCFWADER